MKPEFTIQTIAKTDLSAQFAIEPLPQGFGHTLGNALRRVLYSSIPGAAITGVTISGASHQFATIEGVKEDAVELILNLKQVRLSYAGDKPTQIVLNAKGPGVVTAADFEVSGEVEIANPEQVIATLADKNSKLEIKATVESGLGYSPAEDRKNSTVGYIPVDATFTPITRVNFSVESTRVGRVTNFDKLVMEVITNGTVSADEALKTAAQTLVEYFSAVVNPTTGSSSESTSTSSTSTVAAPVQKANSNRPGGNVSVEELDLPTRISNALSKAGFETVADILVVPQAELAKVKNLGGKSVKIIETALQERGFELSQ